MDGLWGAVGVIAVATIGAFVQLRILSEQSRRERAAEAANEAREMARRDREAIDERYARVNAFVESLARLVPDPPVPDLTSEEAVREQLKLDAQLARARLLATLRPGESGVASFSSLAIETVANTGVSVWHQRAVAAVAEALYSYLRGEKTNDALENIQRHEIA